MDWREKTQTTPQAGWKQAIEVLDLFVFRANWRKPFKNDQHLHRCQILILCDLIRCHQLRQQKMPSRLGVFLRNVWGRSFDFLFSKWHEASFQENCCGGVEGSWRHRGIHGRGFRLSGHWCRVLQHRLWPRADLSGWCRRWAVSWSTSATVSVGFFSSRA